VHKFAPGPRSPALLHVVNLGQLWSGRRRGSRPRLRRLRNQLSQRLGHTFVRQERLVKDVHAEALGDAAQLAHVLGGECLPGGAVGTGDERPVALGRVPEAALQQLGERLRRATDLPFDGGLGWICGSGCSQVRLLREVDRPERARPAHVFAGALQAACTLQAIGLVRQEPVRAGARRAADQVRLPRRPGRLLRFALAGGGLDMGPDGCPTGADLRYEGPANQRRAKADTLSKVRLNVFFRALRLLVHR